MSQWRKSDGGAWVLSMDDGFVIACLVGSEADTFPPLVQERERADRAEADAAREAELAGRAFNLEVDLRLAAEAERDAARARLAEAEALLRSFVEDDNYGESYCFHDHDGNCQAHFGGNPCPWAEARAFLAGGAP